MRILYVAPLESLHTQRWIAYFRDRGHDVHVLSFVDGGEKYIGGVTHHVLPTRPKRFPTPIDWVVAKLPFFRDLRRMVDRIAPDVVHVHVIGFDAFAMARAGVHPLVLTAWGSDILVQTKDSAKVRYLVRTAIRAADRLTCDAEHMRNALVAWGADRAEVHVINFGTDCRLFSPEHRDPELGRALGFPAGAPLVISLRQLKPVYDVATFIRAIPLILTSVPAACFVVASDGNERGPLERLAADTGLAERVRFAGFVPDDELQRYAASATVYVSTSLSDGGLAASTAEAMACGVPPVVTAFGDNPDWVRDGDTGYLFPCGDHRALADRVVQLLQDTDLRRAIGARARGIILERNNRETEMKRVEDLYLQCSAESAR